MVTHAKLSHDDAQIWRLPGEFEPQQALIMAWPHPDTDWAPILEDIRQELAAIIQATLAHQPVVLLVDPTDPHPLPESLSHAPNLHVVALEFDDTWCRDYAPITLISKTQRCFLDFQFTGWGKYSAHLKDNSVTARLHQAPELQSVLAAPHHTPCDLVLEGGAIECNGQGTLLVNWHCMRTRLPTWTMDDITTALKKHLKVHQILGIDIPPLPGDDTDGHIDTLARFVDEKTLLVQTHPHDPTNDTLLAQLAALSIELPLAGSVKPRIVALPCPPSELSLPKSYANFIMINGAVLMPTYNLPTDDMARSVIKSALPDRDIIGVAARALATQAGGPHCTSMHIPQTDHARVRQDG